MLERAKRASHIDPPASSYAIMRRARPYRGENHDPARMFKESLTSRPELENAWEFGPSAKMKHPVFSAGSLSTG